MRIDRQENGKYCIIDEAGQTKAVNLSNEDAWRLYDKYMNEPKSRAESVVDWIASKQVSKGLF